VLDHAGEAAEGVGAGWESECCGVRVGVFAVGLYSLLFFMGLVADIRLLFSDVPLGSATLHIEIHGVRPIAPTKSLSKLGSLFKTTAKPATPAPTESIPLAKFSMNISQSLSTLTPTSVLLDPLDVKVCKGVRMGFAAAAYMDEKWVDEEEEGSETGSVVQAMEEIQVREVEEVEGGLSVMGVQGNGKTVS
jgi:hypothetical protein